jgi:ABC-type thiamin/hydroxymethylpyrimidine transport system permease subunit
MESSPKVNNKLYFETSDLVIIALFASLGGILSAFIGHLGKLISLLIGFPKGGGQIFAGLHIIWFVLVLLNTNRKTGAVLLCGIIKGFIELFSASHIGVLVLYISIGEALVFEIIYFSLSIFLKVKWQDLGIILAAGFAAISNIVIQINTFLGFALPLEILLLILVLCFISGMGFGGFLGLKFFQLFQQSGILNWRKDPEEPNNSSHETSE